MKVRASHAFFFAAAVAASLLLPGLCFADSQARIVRLSSVDGDVQIDRNTGTGFEKAFLNLPITQGVKLQTGSDGRAEVELEDGSTVRLAPGAVMEFSQLGLRDSGAKASSIKLQQGTAYVNFRGGKDDEFSLTFGRETINLNNPAHFRVQMNDANSTLAVFKGNVKAEGTSGSVEVGKNQSVTFDLANRDQYAIAGRVEDAPFDVWDKEQGKYHDTYLSKNRNDSPNAYGVSDLNYYGNYFNAPGYGMLWQPYFVSMGWDPFMEGGWAFSPGYGYTWVSGYPWQWTPYHCGGWLFLPAYGWAWQPGACTNWYSFPRVLNPPARFRTPQPPTAAPGHGTIVMQPRPIISSLHGTANRVVIQNDSAGLGIPRGGIKDLARFSTAVRQNGSVTASFNPAPAIRAPTMPMSGATTSRAGSASHTAKPSGTVNNGPPPSLGTSHSATTHSTTKK